MYHWHSLKIKIKDKFDVFNCIYGLKPGKLDNISIG